MLLNFDFTFILLHLSTILVLILTYLILKMKNKKQISYAFLCVLAFMTLWNIGSLAEKYINYLFDYTSMLAIKLCFISICFISVSFLYLGIIFAKTRILFNWKQIFVFVIPVISTILILTNEKHYLYFVKFSIYRNEAIYGSYFPIHTFYSYGCIFIALCILTYFSIKNSGFFSKQSLLIITGSMFPIIINLIYTYDILRISFYSTPIAFSIAVIFYALAIFKFDFLNVVPIALQTVVDRIPDCFIIINEDLNIIDYNRPFVNSFSKIINFKRNDNIIDIFNSNPELSINETKFTNLITTVTNERKSIKFEYHLFERYYNIDITPIIKNKKYIGTIILFRDTTEQKLDHEKLKQQEKLSILGKLIGGIAHSFKSPILSIFGYTEDIQIAVEDINKLSNGNLSPEIKAELDKINEAADLVIKYIKNMENTIGAVMSHIESEELIIKSESFTTDEFINEIQNYGYMCDFKINAEKNIVVNGGNKSVLMLVFDALINNSIFAYNEIQKEAIIYIDIAKKNNSIKFIVKDYAGGIPKEVADKIFNEVNTTKGTQGTGLGLILSQALLTASFRGSSMTLETCESVGTTWTISIPVIKAPKA